MLLLLYNAAQNLPYVAPPPVLDINSSSGFGADYHSGPTAVGGLTKRLRRAKEKVVKVKPVEIRPLAEVDPELAASVVPEIPPSDLAAMQFLPLANDDEEILSLLMDDDVPSGRDDEDTLALLLAA